MTNAELVEIALAGTERWNRWRQENPGITRPNLCYAALSSADLRGADLRGVEFCFGDLQNAKFCGARLERADFLNSRLAFADFRDAHFLQTTFQRAELLGAHFEHTDLRGAFFFDSHLEASELECVDLREVDLTYAHLRRAKLSHAQLQGAKLLGAFLEETDLSGANLAGADLSLSTLVKTNLSGSNLAGAMVFGISAWKVLLDGAVQTDLCITEEGEPPVSVDDLEVAHFAHLMLSNPNLRKVIDTIGRRGVLILGRFTPERKIVLEAIRSELRRLGYLPILFDFDRPPTRNFTETIVTLAGMSLFVIADITNPSSSPLELQATVPTFNIPFAPIIEKNHKAFSMFNDLQGSFGGRMLDLLTYPSSEMLVRVLETAIIRPALKLSKLLMEQKNLDLRMRKAEDYLDDSINGSAS